MDLKAATRSVLGRKTTTLRREGLIPAELYGHGVDNIHLQVSERDFNDVYDEAGESSVVNLSVDDASEKRPVMIHEVQRDPVSDKVIAVDFYQVRLDEKITVTVPLVFSGVSPAVKDHGGVLVKSIQEVEVEALPQNVPHDITIDISVLKNVGDALHVSDLSVSSDVELSLEGDVVIASVTEKMSEEEDVAQAAPVDVDAVSAEKEKADADKDASAEKKEGA